jgi:NlpC/P60 family putative phage cell wall peptidase
MNTKTLITRAAREWLGTPYRHQASLKGAGCDCLGLIRGVWRDVYGEEPEATPPYSPDWAEAGSTEMLADAARRHMTELNPNEYATGDLLLFRWRSYLPAKHAGIAMAKYKMIHAAENVAVCEISLDRWWQKRIAYAFRFRDRSA